MENRYISDVAHQGGIPVVPIQYEMTNALNMSLVITYVNDPASSFTSTFGT